MPFGLTNTPSTFQATMNRIFTPFLRKFVLVFFDDILIYSPDETTHLKHLTEVLVLLKENYLYAKMSKYIFLKKELQFLGHVISSQGTKLDPEKNSAIEAWPTPTNLKGLREFLGISGYYRKFVKNYASIAALLTDLLKKDAFKWSEITNNSMKTLKEALMNTHVLSHPDFQKKIDIKTDTCINSVGVVLSQELHPNSYFSAKLNGRMLLASTYVKEMHAITQAVGK